jgi:cell division ATPase FtsA
MYFALGDNRKYFSAEDMYSVPTNMIKGALCYYFVTDPFYDLVMKLLQDMGFQKVKFIPSTLAQSYYLLPEKKREGYAFLLDIGFMTSSISVVYGNGIVHEESFDCGVGSILAQLISVLNIDYPVAEELLANANISGGSVPKDMAYYSEIDEKSFPVQKVNDIIKFALDELC